MHMSWKTLGRQKLGQNMGLTGMAASGLHRELGSQREQSTLPTY